MQYFQNSLTQLYPEVEARNSMAEAGRIVLNFHFQRMLQNEAGTRLGEDVEALHDMRVATRRMRAAIRVFKPYYRPVVIKPHREGLKTTGRILGIVRDWDVLLIKTRVYCDSLLMEEQSNLKFLLDRWSQERDEARDDMLAYLDGQPYHDFKLAFSEFVNVPGDNMLDLRSQNWLIFEDAPSVILSRYERVLSHEENLQDPNIQQLHALRIDFKRLRYTVEFFRSTLGETADYCIEELKVLQDYLGDLNDARVALRRIQEFLNLHNQDSSVMAVVKKYHQVKEAELSQMVAAFPQAWSRFRQPEFLQKLDVALKVLRYPI